ncbi:MAG: hypothetical protein L0H79_19135 [Intrasporangium sp.]|uniref:hypothetical protein n=1 Tax=Intrasporangium sp. TaxID=1925024 RepID=UPI00264A0D0F|nr:hypothetical protein [Intrasporangium sp.]MDN5797841.1 hypothetical protein [Intrasporangium sp.]
MTCQRDSGGLAELTQRVIAAGLPVAVEVRGADGAVPREVDWAAYRIVQEGPPPARAQASRDGRGLVGIRKRVAFLGGTIHVDDAPRTWTVGDRLAAASSP